MTCKFLIEFRQSRFLDRSDLGAENRRLAGQFSGAIVGGKIHVDV